MSLDTAKERLREGIYQHGTVEYNARSGDRHVHIDLNTLVEEFLIALEKLDLVDLDGSGPDKRVSEILVDRATHIQVPDADWSVVGSYKDRLAFAILDSLIAHYLTCKKEAKAAVAGV